HSRIDRPSLQTIHRSIEMDTRAIQRALAAAGYSPGPIDGIIGPRTREAVKAFQNAFGLVVDGIAGPQTQTALRRAGERPKPGRPEPDKSAMALAPPAESAGGDDDARPPPNLASLRLLDTARPID